MKEEFLYYLWQFRLFSADKTVCGQRVEVIHPGTRNIDSGPDFFNARIKIGDTTWAGNVEIHLNTSDWFRHRHHLDKAYDNVILHVVYNNDSDVSRLSGEVIPAIELKHCIDKSLYSSYEKMRASHSWIPCYASFKGAGDIVIQNWLERLMIERLERKSAEIGKELDRLKGDWQEVFYLYLVRNFGFKVNSHAFELLARLLPAKIIRKHRHDLHQTEALLFGQAGFLSGRFKDEYPQALRKEYEYLQRKWNLKPMQNDVWRFYRLRPQNFPTIRLAQLAALINSHENLLSDILDTTTKNEIVKIFQTKISGYWKDHYHFDKASKVNHIKKIGDSTINLIIINTLSLLLFLWGKRNDDQQMCDKALGLLEEIPAENNSIIRNFINGGFKPSNAFESQGLIELKNNYCNMKRCLDCRIGHAVLRKLKFN